MLLHKQSDINFSEHRYKSLDLISAGLKAAAKWQLPSLLWKCIPREKLCLGFRHCRCAQHPLLLSNPALSGSVKVSLSTLPVQAKKDLDLEVQSAARSGCRQRHLCAKNKFSLTHSWGFVCLFKSDIYWVWKSMCLWCRCTSGISNFKTHTILWQVEWADRHFTPWDLTCWI